MTMGKPVTNAKSDFLAKAMFMLSIAAIIFAYGVAVGRYQWFPYAWLESAQNGLDEVMVNVGQSRPMYYRSLDHDQLVTVHNPGGAAAGVNLITSVAEDDLLSITIMKNDGQVLHEWLIDWHEIWPDADHVTHGEVPQSRPGTHIHGAVIMDNGDVVFNFEHLGTVRMNPDGEVVWRLPHLTHHSVHQHDDGHLWISSERYHTQPVEDIPHYGPVIREHTVLEVSGEGEVLREISIFDLLQDNGLAGLLYMSSKDNDSVKSRGDTLHLNDVERFPATMEPGFFDENDVMVSLRNINTVIVFDLETMEIKYTSVGQVIRQHDPDFVDGDTISVFDNNTGRVVGGAGSRIITLSPMTDEMDVVFEAAEDQPFYTDIMGKHQWLDNGNLLITESMTGRAFEINPEGDMVWQFVNHVDAGIVGIVEEVTRLPAAVADRYQTRQEASE